VKKLLLLFLTLCFTIISCTSATQLLSVNPKPDTYRVLDQSDCSGCGFLLFGVVPIAWGGMTQRAYHGAVEAKKGDDLINPAVKESWWWIPPVGYIRCTNVSGTVIRKIN